MRPMHITGNSRRKPHNGRLLRLPNANQPAAVCLKKPSQNKLPCVHSGTLFAYKTAQLPSRA